MSIQVRTNEPTKPTPPPISQEPAKAEESASPVEHASAPEAKASEHKESEDSEPSETEAKEESESLESESKQETESKDAEEEEKPKKKGGFQRRIDKLNARYADKEREVEYWKQQALKNAGEPKKDQPVEAKQTQSDGKPNPDNFETISAYVEALTDWKAEQKEKEREQKAQKAKLESEQAELAKSYAERVKAFSEKTEDWEEMLANLDDVPRSPAVESVIVSSEVGPELLYELAKNPKEAKRIAMLPPLAAARELGKIESRLASSASETKQETKKVTNAPKPLAPVNAGGKGSVPKSIYDPNISQAEYERLRREEQKKRRQA